MRLNEDRSGDPDVGLNVIPNAWCLFLKQRLKCVQRAGFRTVVRPVSRLRNNWVGSSRSFSRGRGQKVAGKGRIVMTDKVYIYRFSLSRHVFAELGLISSDGASDHSRANREPSLGLPN